MVLRIALTGATGFVGRTVVAELLARKHSVKALVRTPTRANLPKDVQLIAGDLGNVAALKKLVSNVDVVLHVAGAISAVSRDGYFSANVAGTKCVAEAAHAAGVKRLVFVSSLAAREPELSDYALSKREAERVLEGFSANMEVLVLRPAAVYGEGDFATLPLLSALMSRIAVLPGTRNGRFSLVHGSDLAAVCVDAAAANTTGMLEIDDGSGGHGWEDLAAITQAEFSTPQRLVFLPQPIALAVGLGGDMLARLRGKPMMVSSAKMRELYFPDWVVRGAGWPRSKPVSLQEGLLRTIRWNQSQGLLPQRGQADTSHGAQG